MNYVGSTEHASVLRAYLKAYYPGKKISVKKGSYYAIHVTVPNSIVAEVRQLMQAWRTTWTGMLDDRHNNDMYLTQDTRGRKCIVNQMGVSDFDNAERVNCAVDYIIVQGGTSW